MSSFVRGAVLVAGLLGSAAGNFISPGLGKCMDIKADLKDDGTRETLDDMKKHSDPINVQLYKCTDKENQKWELVGGTIKSASLKRCLSAEAAKPNANVQLDDCKDGDDLQQWDLTAYGYAQLKGTDQCVDVQAAKKEDGTRETWDEIKEHKTVNMQLYTCHDPKKTERVNQLWEWASNGDKGCRGGAEQKWSLGDKEIQTAPNGAGSTIMAASVAAVMGFVLGGLVVSRVVKRQAANEQAGTEMLANE